MKSKTTLREREREREGERRKKSWKQKGGKDKSEEI